MLQTQSDLSLQHYADLIRKGEVVAFPTETVYGLGADAWNSDAVAKIFQLKGRPQDNPLIVHVNSLEMAASFLSDFSEDARRLMEHFWPGPLAFILPKRPEVLDIVTAGLPTVALRMPDHPIPLHIITQTGPIAAPSANTSGRPSPTRPEHVRQDFGDELPVIEGGRCLYGIESTVLDLTQKPYTILRPGHIRQSELEQILLQPIKMNHSACDEKIISTISSTSPRSPGMKYTHYAPDARVRWMKREELAMAEKRDPHTLYLQHGTFYGEEELKESGNIIHYRSNYLEMARDLYDRFRMADRNNYAEIAIRPFDEEEESTAALRNRISKAITR